MFITELAIIQYSIGYGVDYARIGTIDASVPSRWMSA